MQRRRGTGIGTLATVVSVVEVVAMAAMCRSEHDIRHNHGRLRASGKRKKLRRLQRVAVRAIL